MTLWCAHCTSSSFFSISLLAFAKNSRLNVPFADTPRDHRWCSLCRSGGVISMAFALDTWIFTAFNTISKPGCKGCQIFCIQNFMQWCVRAQDRCERSDRSNDGPGLNLIGRWWTESGWSQLQLIRCCKVLQSIAICIFGSIWQHKNLTARSSDPCDDVVLATTATTTTTNNQQPTTNNQQPTTNNHQPPTTNHQPPTTNHQPPTTNHQPPTTNHQPPTTNHQPPTTNHQPPTTNHQPPTTNDQRPTNNEQRTTTNEQRTTNNEQRTTNNEQRTTTTTTTTTATTTTTTTTTTSSTAAAETPRQ